MTSKLVVLSAVILVISATGGCRTSHNPAQTPSADATSTEHAVTTEAPEELSENETEFVRNPTLERLHEAGELTMIDPEQRIREAEPAEGLTEQETEAILLTQAGSCQRLTLCCEGLARIDFIQHGIGVEAISDRCSLTEASHCEASLEGFREAFSTALGPNFPEACQPQL